MEHIESWGRFPRVESRSRPLFWTHEVDLNPHQGLLLAHGLGRSYGDSCLNPEGVLLRTRQLARLLNFDPERGRIRCEAGVSLAELLAVIVPHGWFPPVTPGTKYVTVGGMVANDIHGKNHHRCGSFGRFVERLELLRSDGSRLECSPREHGELFGATIGGLGLTGLITWVEFRLQKINSVWLDCETFKFTDLDTYFQLSRDSRATHQYTVAWLDGIGYKGSAVRGLFMRGNHSMGGPGTGGPPPDREPFLRIPVEAPDWLLNPLAVKLFNTAYYHRRLRRRTCKRVHYDPFFYPLDGVGFWNRLYGRRGFLQYQCIVRDEKGVLEILELGRKARVWFFLGVLKWFGALVSPGLLSFPRQGYTLAMDFPANPRVLAHLNQLDRLVADHGGAVYPAKDARMSGAAFERFFPHWRTFAAFIDPAFSSGFWTRVNEKRTPEN